MAKGRGTRTGARRRGIACAAVVGALALAVAAALPAAATKAAPAAGEPWSRYATPEEGGFSSAKLEAARRAALEGGSAAAVVVHGGHVVFSWGDAARPYPMASMRKSLVSALFGAPVAEGTIDLDATVAELGLDDVGGLTEAERRARLVDLLAARSGIYHVSAYEPPSMALRRPERGSAAPGESWFYNNWDFNAVATVLERATGEDVFRAFRERIAKPIGMEDLGPDDTFWWREPCVTRHPAYLFRMSARDRARFGQLFLQRGRWGDAQIVPEAWVARSTRAATTFGEGHPDGAGNGYGLMWWVHPADPDEGTALGRRAGYLARGSGGQVLVVVPEEDLVFAHAVDTTVGEGIDFRDAMRFANLVLEAKTGAPAGDARLVPFRPERTDAPPPAPLRPAEALAGAALDAVAAELAGVWRAGAGFGMDVHRHGAGLFLRPIGPPFPEIELFALSGDRLVSPAGKVEIEVERDAEGRAARLTLRRPDRSWVATRGE